MNRNQTNCQIAIFFVVSMLGAAFTTPTPAAESRTFVVAADPNNIPFSNESEEGFENKLAKLVARDLNAELKYVWEAQRRGFFKETLGSGKCDAVLGVPAGLSGCITTQPYYRSSYVFVASKSNGPIAQSLEEESLRKCKIGVQMMGDGQMSPPAYALIERGLTNNLVGFSMYSDDRAKNPAAEIVRAVASKKIDVGIAWGPMAGYFAQRSDLIVKPIPRPTTVSEPYSFEICVGVRKDEPTLRDEIDSILHHRNKEISSLLNEYGVPRAESVETLSQGERKP
jgi:mxaJ protein